jgi:hypothetical protein
MAPLTGSQLFNYVQQNLGLPREHIALGSGYIRDDGRPSFVKYYTALMRAIVQNQANLKLGSALTQRIISAINNRQSYRNRNDEVEVSDHCINVFYHNSLIAVVNFRTNKLTIYCNGFYTKSTKDRLNRLLMHLSGVKLFQKNKQWVIISGGENIPFVEGMSIDMI